MKLRVHGTDEYISLSRARWLISARRARFVTAREIQITSGEIHAEPGAGAAARDAADTTLVYWGAYSGGGAPNPARSPWLRGLRMNGAVLRHDQQRRLPAAAGCPAAPRGTRP
ncbi:MAG: hypothetical protein ACRD17_00730 [Terriglobales bacterium]